MYKKKVPHLPIWQAALLAERRNLDAEQSCDWIGRRLVLDVDVRLHYSLSTDRWSDLEHHGKVEVERRQNIISPIHTQILMRHCNRVDLIHNCLTTPICKRAHVRAKHTTRKSPTTFIWHAVSLCCVLLCHSLTTNRLQGFWTFCRSSLFYANESRSEVRWLEFACVILLSIYYLHRM